MLKCDLSLKSWLTAGVTVCALFTLSGTAARAEVFPTVTLINGSNPAHPFNQASLSIQRQVISPTQWLWTYDLNNLKDTGPASSQVPIRRFLIGIDPLAAGDDWQSHIWAKKSAHSTHELPSSFVADGNANFIKPAILDSDDIEWNWDNMSTTNKNDDFLGGTMQFQFVTDLPLVTFTAMEARGSKGPGDGLGASPAAAPEPGTLLLLFTGIAPLLLMHRRRLIR